jgi:peroxiredoxin
VHLQFRRFAGCPICNLHLRSVVRRHDEIVAAGVREVVVFHSGADELGENAEGLPFAVIADPDKRLYAEFGVESSARSLLDPRVWPTIVRAVARSTVRIIRRQDRAPSLRPTGGRYGLPGDFLIGPDGRVLAAKYGAHADDQWSVDELLALVRAERGSAVSQGVS